MTDPNHFVNIPINIYISERGVIEAAHTYLDFESEETKQALFVATHELRKENAKGTGVTHVDSNID